MGLVVFLCLSLLGTTGYAAAAAAASSSSSTVERLRSLSGLLERAAHSDEVDEVAPSLAELEPHLRKVVRRVMERPDEQ